MKDSIMNPIWLCICCWLMVTACADDEWMDNRVPGQGVDRSHYVEVGIPFRLSKGFSSEIITKAGAQGILEDQTGQDSQLSGIMVFVFENNGDPTGARDKFLQFKLLGKPGMTIEGASEDYIVPDATKPTEGHFNLYLPVGDVFIYLVGNAKSSFVHNIFADFQNNDIHDLTTRQEFLKKVVPRWTGNMYAIDGFLPMAGKVDNASGACTIKVDPKQPGGDRGMIEYLDRNNRLQTIGGTPISSTNSFFLSRIMCKVSMEFLTDSTNPNLKFTPKTYKFYHCPLVIPPVEDFRDVAYYGSEMRDTETVPFDAQSPNSFVVYLPENMQAYTGTGITSFKDRDKVKKDAQGKNLYEQNMPGHEHHYVFEHAPKNATYVEVTGHLENTQTDQSADVRYLIHLGNFGKDIRDFNLARDWHYHYKVTVKGANDIVIEVLGPAGDGNNAHEQNPAVEGIVFTGGARVQLDSHYEQVEMKFDKQQFANGVLIYADTPFGNVHCRYLPSQQKLDPAYPNVPATQAEILKLLDWVEYRPQTKAGVLARYADPVHHTKPMNVFELLDYVYKQPATGYYTCFVNEYYYSQHPLGPTYSLQLSDFINAPDRTFCLGSKISYSQDMQSAVAQAVYMLQQSSIACFYDLKDTSKKKYGVELVDEIGQLPYGTPVKEGSDLKNGRLNCFAEIQKVNVAVDWASNGYILDPKTGKYTQKENPNRLLPTYQQAHLACLARNRDFDGDGLILENELRWYTPARDQVFGLWIGEPAMPKGAALYPYNTSNLKPNDEKVSQYPIFTSSNGKNRVVWGEQGCSFGDEKGAGAGGYVRVIRNLGNGDFTKITNQETFEIQAEPYYEYDKVNRTIKLFLTQNALRAYTSRELSPHHERSYSNRPYKVFQVARHPYVSPVVQDDCPGHYFTGSYGKSPEYHRLYTTPAKKAKEDPVTLASGYTGDGNTPNSANWRLPNQREMLIMIVALGNLFDYPMDSYDQFSVMKYGCSYNVFFGHRWKPVYNQILHCRTSFSNKNYTPMGFMYNVRDKIMQTIWTSNDQNAQNLGMGADGTAGYFCVRDVLQP